VPFPAEVLPVPVRDYAVQAAAAIGCDVSFVALPLLAALGAAIGNSRRIALRRGWAEPPLLWTVIVGESGTLKSPALDAALHFTQSTQDLAFAKHRQDVEECRRMAESGDGEAGEPPPPQRYLVSDVTVEALAVLLRDAPRGLLLAREELAGWLKSHDQYRQGRGGDLQHYLAMHGARSMTIDRRTGDQRTIHVPRAFLAITGGVQPGTLRQVLTRESYETGLAARLLLAMPPRSRRMWSELEVDPRTRDALARVFSGLWDMAMQPHEGGDRPWLLSLDAAGKAAWVAFFEEHAAEQLGRSGDLAAAWSKLEGYCARLALIVHCCRQAAGDPTLPDPDLVDRQSVEAAVRLVRWFGREVGRVYGVLHRSQQEGDDGAALEWVRAQGRPVTARDLQRSHGGRRYASAGAADEVLRRLVRSGWLVAETAGPGPQGGRPATRYRCGPT
jgi:hypothetical protein